MMQAVLVSEIPAFEQAFQLVMSGYKPKLCFIIVKKRIHTRLFETTGTSYYHYYINILLLSSSFFAMYVVGLFLILLLGNDLINPTPGTVVDQGCTTLTYPNFYIISNFQAFNKVLFLFFV